jgi:hypothetical protein
MRVHKVEFGGTGMVVVRMPQWPERRDGLHHVLMVPVVDDALCMLVLDILPVHHWPSWNGLAIQRFLGATATAI